MARPPKREDVGESSGYDPSHRGTSSSGRPHGTSIWKRLGILHLQCSTLGYESPAGKGRGPVADNGY
jgi:hypothetical protein